MKYEKRIIVFLDILNFKNVVNSTLDDNNHSIENKIKELKSALLSIRDILRLDEKNKKYAPKSRQATHFSDSFVISFKINEKSEVFHTLINLLHIIMSLLQRKLLCRGAIVYDKVIHTKKLLFGPGIISAYEAESKAALYPRIILDETVLKIAIQSHANHHTPKIEYSYLRDILQKDTDNMYYIDYFSAAQSELDDSDYEMPDYIENLRTIIASNINSRQSGIRIKYQWLQNKFNKMIKLYKSKKYINSLIKNGYEYDLINYYKKLAYI